MLTSDEWATANQRYLVAALDEVRAALDRHSGLGEGTSHDAPAPMGSALEAVCDIFGLSAFERLVLLLCAGVELDAGFAEVCAAAQPGLPGPTFGLALAALPGAHWSAITPGASLRRWRLIELAAGDSPTRGVLRVDERILHFLAGVNELDERLVGVLGPPVAPSVLPPSHAAIADRIASFWQGERPAAGWPLVVLTGVDQAAKSALAATACAALGLTLRVLPGTAIPAVQAEREALARLCTREAMLSATALLVDGELADDPAPISSFLDAVSGLGLIACREAPPDLRRTTLRIDVERPTRAEQRAVWRAALGTEDAAVADQFDFGATQIASAIAQADSDPAPAARAARLWEACRAQARPRIEAVAQRVASSVAWDDLVLPPAQRAALEEIVAHVRHRVLVHEQWGFAARGSRGLGTSALFAGASGTGKTMAAEVLAGELRLDLYRIDLSAVVSKYIGETEKNLRRVFDAAEGGGAILLFDEADALFGKRTEIKDSHDRYANIEVSYLLQRMEAYRGLAILTTNLRGALDPAFLRRLRFTIEFPFPDAAGRAEIWRRAFPADTPTTGLDPTRLARLDITGGTISNLAMNAAFLAAAAGESVGMSHVLAAARSEYAKLDKPLTASEIAGWA